MDNKKPSLRKKDKTLLNEIYSTMTSQGRTALESKYGAIEQSELNGKSEAYHFKNYKDKLLNGVQQGNLDDLLIGRGRNRGIEIVDRLPTEKSTSLQMARDIFECFANAKNISQPECLLEFLTPILHEGRWQFLYNLL